MSISKKEFVKSVLNLVKEKGKKIKKIDIENLFETNKNETITITFGDKAENHAGMQIIGKDVKNGYSLKDLKNIQKYFINKSEELKLDIETEIVNLHELEFDDEYKCEEAYLLIIKKGVQVFCEQSDIFNELINLEWDTKAKMRGKVVNKHARHNLCFSDFDQKQDIENGKGTIINLNRVPNLNLVYDGLKNIITKNKDLVVEGNYYYDVTKCGIGYHGDSERKRVIGLRLGASMPLVFKWYHKFNPVSQEFKIDLEDGDMYVMSSKTVGTDWKKSSILTLRHAAGCKKYIE